MASNANVIRLSRTAVLVKIETSEGVDASPTGASNAVQVLEGEITPAGETLDRQPLKSSDAAEAPVTGQTWWEFSFTCEAKTNGNADAGTAGNEPEFHPLMQIAAMKASYEAAVRIRYRPSSDRTDHKTATIYVYTDGRLHKLLACRASVEYTTGAGNFGRFIFTGRGKYVTPTDAAMPSVTVLTTDPPTLAAACMELGSPSVFNPVIENFSVNMQNDISNRPDACATYAIKGFVMGRRNPQGGYDPEATLAADHDFWADWIAKTERLLRVQNGTTAGQIIEIKVPKSVIREMPYGSRETYRTHDISYQAVGGTTNSGDDDVEIIFR